MFSNSSHERRLGDTRLAVDSYGRFTCIYGKKPNFKYQFHFEAKRLSFKNWYFVSLLKEIVPFHIYTTNGSSLTVMAVTLPDPQTFGKQQPVVKELDNKTAWIVSKTLDKTYIWTVNVEFQPSKLKTYSTCGFVSKKGTCIYIPTTWSEAFQICQYWNASLPQFLNEKEQKEFLALLKLLDFETKPFASGEGFYLNLISRTQKEQVRKVLWV